MVLAVNGPPALDAPAGSVMLGKLQLESDKSNGERRAESNYALGSGAVRVGVF